MHGDPSLDAPFESFAAKLAAFEPVVLPVPTIEVDTTIGLDPGLEAILSALARPRFAELTEARPSGRASVVRDRPGSGLTPYAVFALAGPL